MASVDVRHGDCLEVLGGLPDNSVDAVVTDPPYGLSNTDPQRVVDTIARWASGDDEYVPKGRGFMGASWDGFVPPPAVWQECLRVLKPGGHMAVFSGARTQDLMGLSIRLAGFEIRDTLAWIYGSGMPRSMDVSKAIDAEVLYGATHSSEISKVRKARTNDDPLTSEGKTWRGWGTALRPSIEPIILARKPYLSSLSKNILESRTGAINVRDSRLPSSEKVPGGGRSGGMLFLGGCSSVDELRHLARSGMNTPNGEDAKKSLARFEMAKPREGHSEGRYPSNVLLDDWAAEEVEGHSPGAQKFFPVFKYQAKAPKKERPVIEREDGTKIQHPTVKPEKLMEWLVTLITPPGGTVLDPFAGSGTTLEAARNKNFNAIGIEREPDYCELIHHRLGAKSGHRKDKNDPDS